MPPKNQKVKLECAYDATLCLWVATVLDATGAKAGKISYVNGAWAEHDIPETDGGALAREVLRKLMWSDVEPKAAFEVELD